MPTDQADSIASLECSLDQLAALAGVSSRHVRRLLGDTPQTRRGRWALGPAFAALMDGLAGGPAGGDLTKERTGLVRAQRMKAEMEYALAKKDIAPIWQMERAMEKRMAMIRARMLQVPQRACIQIVGEKSDARIKAVLGDEIKLALRDAADEELTPEMIGEEPDENDDTDHE